MCKRFIARVSSLLRDPIVKRYDFSGFFADLMGPIMVQRMFTGIIEDLGKVEEMKLTDKGAVLGVRTAIPVAKFAVGDSVAVNGTCLTVIGKGRGTIRMDVSA